MTGLEGNEAVLLLGSASGYRIAIVDIPSGRIVRTMPIDHGDITALAGSPDGKTIYCSAGGTIWAIPASGAGEPRKLHAGTSVAAEPNGKFLVVSVPEFPAVRLVRVSLEGAPDVEIPHPPDLEPIGSLQPREGHQA